MRSVQSFFIWLALGVLIGLLYGPFAFIVAYFTGSDPDGEK
jgi:hypothetical protein